MSDSILKLCPTCNIDVEYEEGDGKSFCPECGRTHSLALEVVAFNKKTTLNKRMKSIFKIFGYSLIAIILIIVFLIAPERAWDKGITTAKGMLILAIPGVILMLFVYWKNSKKNKQSSTENIDKQESAEPQKSKSVVITSDGEIIRTLDDGSVKSTSNIGKDNIGEDNIMWDFKLKKTRIILIISILWILILYFGILFDSYYEIEEWLFFFLWGTPVWIYWVGIPSYRWVMKGK